MSCGLPPAFGAAPARVEPAGFGLVAPLGHLGLSLAAEGGYDAVQMRDVAARAEVALGTLYRHYASKDQLLLAAMAEQGYD